MPKPTSAALYFRTSTDRQHLANQRPEVEALAATVEALAAARGFEVVATYEEQESAVKHRSAYERMMADARRGHFKVIVVWSLDRLGRGFGCFDAFRDLARFGVRVASVREPWTEADGPALNRRLNQFPSCTLSDVVSWVEGLTRRPT